MAPSRQQLRPQARGGPDRGVEKSGVPEVRVGGAQIQGVEKLGCLKSRWGCPFTGGGEGQGARGSGPTVGGDEVTKGGGGCAPGAS